MRTGWPPTEVHNPQPPQKCSGECSERCRPETGCKCMESARPPCSKLPRGETRRTSTFPSTSPSTPFLAGTSPSTLRRTFGGLGVFVRKRSHGGRTRALVSRRVVFLTFRGPFPSHDSNPFPNRSRIARYNATKIRNYRFSIFWADL